MSVLKEYILLKIYRGKYSFSLGLIVYFPLSNSGFSNDSSGAWSLKFISLNFHMNRGDDVGNTTVCGVELEKDELN